MKELKRLFRLDGKVTIVTGGIGLLGREFVKTLVGAGAKVAIFDLQTEHSKKVNKILRDKNVAFYKTDVTKKESIEGALKAITKKWKTPQILINAAAIDIPPKYSPKKINLFETYSEKSLDEIMKVNVEGTLLCSQIIGRAMAGANGGSIINISSIYGEISPDQRIYVRKEKKRTFIKPISYCVSKGAIPNLTRYLATYWAKKNIRVNTLTFGGVFNKQNREFVKNYSSRVPMGRMAKRDEYNGAMLFLASDASSYMTGANLIIDGGYTAW